MINISRLYCDQKTPGDWIRYGQPSGKQKIHNPPGHAARRKPVIVWNVTDACNLNCIHCYSNSKNRPAENELSTKQAKELLKDLAGFGIPAVLFSGGEPLMREDIFDLLALAERLGLPTVLSTNGTLISQDIARKIKTYSVSYVGVSLDGIGEVNDKFRGKKGAFQDALKGIENCRKNGIRTGLRLTLTKTNVSQLDDFFGLFEQLDIERVCFYHLVPVGRAGNIRNQTLTHQQTRQAVDVILQKTKKLKEKGKSTDILTVDNHVDGVYLYRKILSEENAPENNRRSQKIWNLLTWNGGGLYSSGVGIASIDCRGNVHPDQFWSHYSLGSVLHRPFSKIWSDPDEPLLKGLRNRKKYIKGRCRLCKYFPACGGSLRVRADLYFSDPWAPEPACYLSDHEIGLDRKKIQQLKQQGQLFRMPD